MDLREIKEYLVSKGIQASAPRLAVADYVFNTMDHPSAEEVKEEVERRTPSVSTATIYNTLNLFVEKGLLRVIQDPITHKHRYDCNTRPHFHFYDEESGQLLDLDPSVLKVSPNFNRLNDEFDIKDIEVVVRGRKRKKS